MTDEGLTTEHASAGGMTTEGVSVIVPYFDAVSTLGQQLESLVAQRDAPPFEVIVADNMSAEPPESVVGEWSDRLDIRIVRAPEAQGVSAARNVGIREARHNALAFVDSDDVAGATFVRAALEALRQADVVTGTVVPVDASEFAAGVEHVRTFLPDVHDAASVEGIASTRYPILMGGACAMTRAAALRLDGFDQRFFPGAEDNDLALRAVRTGERIVRSPGMTLAERRRDTTGGAFRRSYDAGRMHMALCSAHDLWAVSPHLRDPLWWLDALKVPLAALRTAAREGRSADWLPLAGRAGLRLGQARGYWEFRVLKRPVMTQRGIGLRQDAIQ